MGYETRVYFTRSELMAQPDDDCVYFIKVGNDNDYKLYRKASLIQMMNNLSVDKLELTILMPT